MSFVSPVSQADGTRMTNSPIVHRALISVSDKSGLVEFAQEITDLGIEIFSTGGTRQHLLEGIFSNERFLTKKSGQN